MTAKEHSPTRIAVIGAGLMGHGIAQAFMVADFDVAIWDPEPEVRRSVPQRVSSHLAQMGIKREITIKVCDSLEDCVRGCHLLVEVIPEQLDLKRQLIRDVDSLNPDCIIATNTSVLRITEIAQGSQDPGRVIGTHWWNPPYLIPLVEVIHGELTRKDVAQEVVEILTRAGKTPVEVFKDVPGFVGNRMQFALVREALHIVEQGICSAQTVDLVARMTFGRRLGAVGPLQNADFIGLDLTAAILEYLSPHLCDAKVPSGLISNNVQEKVLGAKTGQGIYQWPPGARERLEEKLLEHLIQADRTDRGPHAA